MVNATLVICAQEKDQNIHMRRSLGASYDTASMSIDIHKDVPIASQSQQWQVNIMDNDKAKINPDVTIQLGKKAIVDL